MLISDWSSDVCSSDLNSAGGTVVLLQPQGAGTGIIAQEALHVFDFRAAPAVDRLIVVADHEHLAALAGQHPDHRVLDGVGILKLIDQDLPEALLIMRQQRRLRSEEHTSELQSLMRTSYAVFCLKKNTRT